MSLDLVTLARPHGPVLLPHGGAGAHLAVIRRAQDSVAVETVSAELAVITARVVRAVTDPGLLVAVVRVTVAVAGNAPGKGAAIVFMVKAKLTLFTEVTSVALGTVALLY